MDAFPDRVLFQTREWLEFVMRTQDAEPVVACLRREGEGIGYFTGLIIRRFGIRILGSPFPGWTTTSMGFNLVDGIERWDAVEALLPFAFGELGCLHVELKDRYLTGAAPGWLRLTASPQQTFEIDLTSSEEEIFARMISACRRAIRKGEKVGVRVEEASGEAFADEYYEQLLEVFGRQELKPTFDRERVRELIRCLEPTGRLLLLRALSPDGERIATGLFPAMNRAAYFWGGASWREHQIHRPNEAIFWYAIRYWKARGIPALDMGGGGEYKRRYGPVEFDVPSFRRSKLPGLLQLRDAAAYLKTRKY